MRYFLTSSLCFYGKPEIDPSNGLMERLHAALPDPIRGLLICSDPNAHERTVFFGNEIKAGFENAGFSVASYEFLDGQNADRAKELLDRSNLIVLSGGHVPTQNRFFKQIRLKELLKTFDGTLIGISAGSMNCAKIVYAQPEEPGEAIDPSYVRFLPGLGLTETILLPHYQAYRDDILDGLRVYEDITYPDSYGRCFYAIEDGGYLYGDGMGEWLFGAAYRIENGTLTPVLHGGESLRIR